MPDTVRQYFYILSIGALLCVSFFAVQARADTADELQAQIDSSTAKIIQLKTEIGQLQTQLTEVGTQKQTLQSALQEINLSIQKITKSITLTQAQIAQKDLEINKLSGNILVTTSNIGAARDQVSHTLRALSSVDQQPMMVVFLSGGTLSSFFDDSATLSTLRNELEGRIHTLSELKDDLQSSKSTAEDKRKELAILNSNLLSQKQSLAVARNSQTDLLAQTKNKESTYQSLLSQKRAQESKFESDLSNLESQLKKTIAAGSFAAAGAGVLSWPLDKVRITQYFGNTDFSTKNPQIYNGRGHNAIDLAATDGTPVKAALSGTIVDTGNTDLQKGCYSYGKWVLIQHNNGLSTLYAHLSVIGVQKGQSVSTGEVIGYSGRTGYATGPHLHFSVYATEGVSVVTFTRSINCKNVAIPIADPTAYLNPLSYLPSL